MNSRRTALFVLSILLLSMISPLMITNTQAYDYTKKKETYTILFDEGHYQDFKVSNFSIGFDAANKTLKEKYGVSFKIQVLKTPFNRTNLQFADLIIITNPGLFPNGTVAKFTDNEIRALTDYVQIGGNVLISGNPYIPHSNFSGHVGPLNKVLREIHFGGIRFYAEGIEANESTVLVNDFINDGNSSHVLVNSSYITAENPLFKEPLNATNFVVYSQSVTLDPLVEGFKSAQKLLIAKTPPTTYTVKPGYSIDQIYKHPAWLAYYEDNTTKARSVITGSTLMFSDMIDSYNNQTWINKADHKNLFVNIIAWLLHLSPTKKIDTTLEKSVGVLMLIEIGIGIALSLILLIIFYLYLLKLKRSGKVFSSMVKKEQQKSKEDKESETQKTKKEKKKKKKRGR